VNQYTEIYPGLPYQINTFLDKNENDPYPICLSVFDLEILTHYLIDPYDFLYYIRQRISLMDYYLADEEIAYLGFHLDQKLWKFPDSNCFIDSSYAQIIDRNYYPFKANINISDRGDVLKRRWTDKDFEQICNELKQLKSDKISNILFHLFDLNGESRINLGKYILKSKSKTLNDNKSHSFSLTSSDKNSNSQGISYLSFESDDINELKDRLIKFCDLKKYERKKDTWIGLGSLKKSNSIDIVYMNEEEWKFDEKLDKIVSKELVGKGQFIKTNKISRNEKCLCGSGLKFKKCCGKLNDK